ncbi:phage integrase [Pseudomonas sp. ATCC 13867]|nr:phage integrase [Pseudomonas sp. ATCC 13867]
MPLTDSTVRTAKPREKLYRLSDTLGLSLEITTTSSKLWRFRYRFAGKPKMISLGPYPAVTLAKARELRDVARSQVAAGIPTTTLARSKLKCASQAGLESSPLFRQVAL